MIEIIKEGNVPRFKTKCTVCGCEFEFDQADVELFLKKVMGTSLRTTVKCPCCFTSIDESLWESLDNKKETK